MQANKQANRRRPLVSGFENTSDIVIHTCIEGLEPNLQQNLSSSDRFSHNELRGEHQSKKIIVEGEEQQHIKVSKLQRE